MRQSDYKAIFKNHKISSLHASLDSTSMNKILSFCCCKSFMYGYEILNECLLKGNPFMSNIAESKYDYIYVPWWGILIPFLDHQMKNLIQETLLQNNECYPVNSHP